MEITVAGGKGRDLTIRIEADLPRARRKYLERGFKFIFGPLAEHEPAAHAADGYRQYVAVIGSEFSLVMCAALEAPSTRRSRLAFINWAK